jgi:hypothetical protein
MRCTKTHIVCMYAMKINILQCAIDLLLGRHMLIQKESSIEHCDASGCFIERDHRNAEHKDTHAIKPPQNTRAGIVKISSI